VEEELMTRTASFGSSFKRPLLVQDITVAKLSGISCS
jgi:hypothetical protein